MKQACESVGSYDVEKRVNARARDGWIVLHMVAVGGLVHIVFAAAQTSEEQAEKDRKTREAFKAAAEHSANLQLRIHQLTKRAETAERQLAEVERAKLRAYIVQGTEKEREAHDRIQDFYGMPILSGDAVPKTSPETVPESGPENWPGDDSQGGPSR
jgi:hypothetical protein